MIIYNDDCRLSRYQHFFVDINFGIACREHGYPNPLQDVISKGMNRPALSSAANSPERPCVLPQKFITAKPKGLPREKTHKEGAIAYTELRQSLLAARTQTAADAGYKIVSSAGPVSACGSRKNVSEICGIGAVAVNSGQFSRAAAEEVSYAIDDARQ